MREVDAAIKAASETGEHSPYVFSLITSALGNVATEADAAKAAFEREQEAVHGEAEAHGVGAGAADTHAESEFDLGTALEENISFADELTGALETLAGVQLDAAKSELAWEEAIDELTKGLKGGADALDNRTEKGRANLKLIHSSIDAAIEHGGAVAEETGSLKKGAAATADHIRQLIIEAQKSGIAKAQIEKYIRALNLTPKQIKTLIELNTGPAQSALDMFIRNAEGRIIGLTAHLTADISPGHTKHAGGVVGESGARRMHGGGRLRSNESIVVAEHGEHVVTDAKYRALQSAAASGSRIRPDTHGGGETVVKVGVRLDRRRFTRSMDHEANYDGEWA
jgi:hypothetical protein